MAIQITTNAVLAVAEQIDTSNKKIRDEFNDLESTIRILQQDWEGEAANTCARKYHHIKQQFSDARFSVVNDLFLFLHQVDDSYNQVDQALSKAASAFK